MESNQFLQWQRKLCLLAATARRLDPTTGCGLQFLYILLKIVVRIKLQGYKPQLTNEIDSINRF